VVASTSANLNIRGSGLFAALGVAKKPFTKYRDWPLEDGNREISLGPVVLGGGGVYYTKASQQTIDYAKNEDGTDKLVDIGRLLNDIFYNVDSPVPVQSFTFPGKMIALNDAFASALIHDDIYIESRNE
jgi:hypothetical protein